MLLLIEPCLLMLVIYTNSKKLLQQIKPQFLNNRAEVFYALSFDIIRFRTNFGLQKKVKLFY